jgi:hypothetical protein
MAHVARRLSAPSNGWPWVKHLFGDAAYDRRTLMDKAAFMDFTIEVVRKLEGQQGFAVQPRRWVVERTFGWLIRWRRLVRDYEQRIDVSRNMIYVAHWSRAPVLPGAFPRLGYPAVTRSDEASRKEKRITGNR